MTKDELIELALEALEDLGMKHFESTGEVLYKETFTAIKEALAQQALDKKAENARELGLDYEPENTLHWHALNYRTAPTQNAQAMFEALEKFVASQRKEPEQEPVGLIESLKDAQPCCGEYQTCWRACTPRGKFLAQRTWVGLTDEEIEQMGLSNYIKVVRETEAKLKEKNT